MLRHTPFLFCALIHVSLLIVQRALMEAKKSYIRYVAHELRTPLNSASLGVNWLLNTLEEIQEKEDLDLELQETATDVSKALKVAVDVLSDLMTISKIESGAMTLHKNDLGAKTFVQDGIASLAAEAREKRVTVEVKPLATGLGQSVKGQEREPSTAPGRSLAHALSSRIFDRPGESIRSIGNRGRSKAAPDALLFPEARELTPLDVVSADKFKVRPLIAETTKRYHPSHPCFTFFFIVCPQLNQVMRNILSNAIKYSSAGTTVTVCAGFIETDEGKTPLIPVKMSSVGSLVGRVGKFNGAKMLLRHGSAIGVAKGVRSLLAASTLTSPRAVHPDKTTRGAVSAVGASGGVEAQQKEAAGVAGELVVAVKDTGKGMDEAELKAAFDEERKVRRFFCLYAAHFISSHSLALFLHPVRPGRLARGRGPGLRLVHQQGDRGVARGLDRGALGGPGQGQRLHLPRAHAPRRCHPRPE